MRHSADPTPVTSGERVSDVVARDESLVEVFVRHSPHFAKLRNRAMRRVMARLVTVDQAARIAGVDAAALVAELNAALGIKAEAPSPDHPSAGSPPAPAEPAGVQRPAGAPELEVDVREDLRAGREPFSKIMAAVAALTPRQVLRLRAIFEPAPLYTVLGRRGFVHETRQEGPEDWSVWFWRPETSAEGSAEPATIEAGPEPGSAGQGPVEAGTVRLDVRNLEPPEPMLRTLAALEQLPAGHRLVQINQRVPQFLLPILAERGFAWQIEEPEAGLVLVRIWRPD
jgi:uncharacterized protein (DUF2249 family)